MRFFKTILLCVPFLACGGVFAQQNALETSIEIKADADFLFLPVSPSVDNRQVVIRDESGAVLFDEYVMLSVGKGQWFAPVDVSKFRGRKLTVSYPNKNFVGSPAIIASDSVPSPDISDDPKRPAFHITATRGLLGGSSGLFYFRGKYYAYGLQNKFCFSLRGTFAPVLWESSDMLNWNALETPSLVTSAMKSPASACVDETNRSGLFAGAESGGVIFAMSDASGVTFFATTTNLRDIVRADTVAKIGGSGRWPQLFFNADSGLWTLVRTETESDGKTHFAAIYVSKDLRSWEKTCAAYRQMAFTNVSLIRADVYGAGGSKWALLSGDGKYVAGDFDGRVFTQTSKNPSTIFGGTILYIQQWSNLPNVETMVTASIMQPVSVMRHLKQNYMNVLSLPWKLNFVRTNSGDFQLRASVAAQVSAHIGAPQVADRGLFFVSNTFTVPDAYGNRCVYDVWFEVGNDTSSVLIEVGVGVFGANIEDSNYYMRRLIENIGEWRAPLSRGFTEVGVRAFVDSYCVETLWYAGDMVMIMGDSFLNPEQTFKVGSVGATKIRKIEKSDIYKNSVARLREAAAEFYKDTLRGVPKQSDAQQQSSSQSQPSEPQSAQPENGGAPTVPSVGSNPASDGGAKFAPNGGVQPAKLQTSSAAPSANN